MCTTNANPGPLWLTTADTNERHYRQDEVYDITRKTRQTVRYRFTFLETVTRSNRLVFNGTVSDKIRR